MIDKSLIKNELEEPTSNSCSVDSPCGPTDVQLRSARLTKPRPSESDFDQASIATNPNSDWRIMENPILEMVDMSKTSAKGPPLFALRFPDLFVY